MRHLLALLVHLILSHLRLCRPGGARAVITESLLLKHQLLILNRGRQRAPNLRPRDQFIAATCALFIRRGRVRRSALVLKPSTILAFHRALVRWKDRLLFSPRWRARPGPRGPAPELITAIVEMKRRNPRWGCPRIAQQIVLAFGVQAGALDGVAVYRMFNAIIGRCSPPQLLSTDHDPLFEFHRWKANLRVLGIDEIKTVPYTPISHPFVERLTGTLRREYLDHVPFWGTADLRRKLADFQSFYNAHRVHTALGGRTPGQRAGQPVPAPLSLQHFGWQSICRGLFQTPVAV